MTTKATHATVRRNTVWTTVLLSMLSLCTATGEGMTMPGPTVWHCTTVLTVLDSIVQYCLVLYSTVNYSATQSQMCFAHSTPERWPSSVAQALAMVMYSTIQCHTIPNSLCTYHIREVAPQRGSNLPVLNVGGGAVPKHPPGRLGVLAVHQRGAVVGARGQQGPRVRPPDGIDLPVMVRQAGKRLGAGRVQLSGLREDRGHVPDAHLHGRRATRSGGAAYGDAALTAVRCGTDCCQMEHWLLSNAARRAAFDSSPPAAVKTRQEGCVLTKKQKTQKTKHGGLSDAALTASEKDWPVLQIRTCTDETQRIRWVLFTLSARHC